MSCEKEVSSIRKQMEKDDEGARALDLLKALRDLPVSLKILTDTGYGEFAITFDYDKDKDNNSVLAPTGALYFIVCYC